MKKTYIGTKDGENVFIEWKLKDGKFSASGEYMNVMGTDSSQAGQCIDNIIEDFPDSAQAQAIHKVWQLWHLNDMRAGSPIQMKLVREQIRPEFERIQESNIKHNREYDKIYRNVTEVINRKKDHPRANASRVIDAWRRRFPNLDFGRGFTTLRIIDPEYVRLVGGVVDEAIPQRTTVYLLTSGVKILLEGARKTPDYYTYITSELEKLGRLYDPDFLKRGVPYKYGSAWLMEELPPEIVTEIESWEEVPFTKKTVIQQLVAKHTCSIVRERDEKDRRRYTFTIDDVSFDFFTGTGFKLEDVTPELILGSLVEDARYGEGDLYQTLDNIADLGYDDPKEEVRIAHALMVVYEKLSDIGVLFQLEELMGEDE